MANVILFGYEICGEAADEMSTSREEKWLRRRGTAQILEALFLDSFSSSLHPV